MLGRLESRAATAGFGGGAPALRRPFGSIVTEAELMEGCRRGEREAQRELYARTADRTYRVLLRMTRNADDAFDLAQETYLRAFERMGQFKGTSSLGTWVYRIAVNEGLQFLRRRKTGIGAVERRAALAEQANGASAADSRLDLAEAIDRLPDAERTLVILRHFEELDYAEIARVMEIPAGTVASGLNRARRMLREMLEASAPAEGLKNRGLPSIQGCGD